MLKRMVKTDISWTELASLAKQGKTDSAVKSGDEIDIMLKDGRTAFAKAARDGNGRFYFIIPGSRPTKLAYSRCSPPDNGAWRDSPARVQAIELFRILPDELRDAIRKERIVQKICGKEIVSEDFLFPLSATQVFGGEEYAGRDADGETQLDIFTEKKNRIFRYNGVEYPWFTRTLKYTDIPNPGYYIGVSSIGGPRTADVFMPGAGVYAFCLE